MPSIVSRAINVARLFRYAAEKGELPLITHIRIHGVATYSEPVDVDFKEINFIYGGNGTGKTTLSKLISGDISSHLSTVVDDNCENEDILVYNKPFVDRNFREVGNISGIFTLGRDAGEAQDFIQEKENELNVITEQIEKKQRSIRKLQEEQADLLTKFCDECWAKQVQYGPVFPKALTGTRGAKAAFAQKCIDEFNSFSGEPKPEESLREIYHAAFSKEASTYDLYSPPNVNSVAALDEHELLQKRIAGKADSDIGRFIEYLGSSDWVRRGMSFACKTDGRCPYCAQSLPDNIKDDIEAFFDLTYQNECAALDLYRMDYAQYHRALIANLNEIVLSQYDILDYSELRAKTELYRTRIDKNLGLIKQKCETPSLEIEIEPCLELLNEIVRIIEEFNEKITQNNTFIEHQKDTQISCSREVWRLIVSELRGTISEYNKQKNGKEKAVTAITTQMNGLIRQRDEIGEAIRQKRSSISNVEHTVDSINTILRGYGFNGFELAANTDTSGTYKIIRPDGSDAKPSLSEGEYNFITFLYFYHLVFGSRSPDALNRNKIIVIDDPISSLDSNVLFIVSSLVKNILTFCRKGQHSVKQVFVSTHNIYFHKEITFLGSGNSWPETKTVFCVIRKKNNVSSITTYTENPIQSSYEMLWDDIRTPSNGTAKSIFNTMRRVLENYFNIIGGIDYEKCINDFVGEDKLICKSLISCINEQSHTISDDYYMCIEDSELEHYLEIFKQIFESMGHASHYNMMMKITGPQE